MERRSPLRPLLPSYSAASACCGLVVLSVSVLSCCLVFWVWVGVQVSSRMSLLDLCLMPSGGVSFGVLY